jgi:exopolyphosphatase / guanosine-5'-triphosphate,3'-diphosphate pyrophosphatase
MTLAAIDVGTNSAKLLVGRVEGREVTPLLHRSVVTRLGEGLDRTGSISPVAADRTIALLREYRELAVERGATALVAAGTQVFRGASNAADVVARALQEAGVEIRVLSAHDEARLSFLGAAGAARTPRALAVDIGGGSTEVMVGSGEDLHASWSVATGAVTLTERHLRSDPPSSAEMLALAADAQEALQPVVVRAGDDCEVVGIGGTVSSLLRALRLTSGEDAREHHGRFVAFPEIEALSIRLSLMTVKEREALGLEPGRADIVVAGAWLLVAAMSRVEARGLRASARGLRHGLLLELSRSSG